MIFGSPYRDMLKKDISSGKTGKKLSEKLLCVLLTHLTELQHSLQEDFQKVCSCGICKVIFASPWRAMGKKEISPVKNWKEAF